MSTNVPGFQSFFRFFASFLLAKLATSSKRDSIQVNSEYLGDPFQIFNNCLYKCFFS